MCSDNQQPCSNHNAQNGLGTLKFHEASVIVQPEGKAQLSSLDRATFWPLHAGLDSGQMLFLHLWSDIEEKLLKASAKSLFGLQMSCSEHSNEDFNHFCVRAVDALECLQWCLWLL